jgi:16S rRNA (uracil1498-N3)-methyltransferase
VVRFKGDKLAKRQLHWHKIVIGACEQSGRSVIPKVLAPINLRDFLQQPVVNGFVLHHRCEQTLLALTAVDEPSLSPARTRFKEITYWTKIGFC